MMTGHAGRLLRQYLRPQWPRVALLALLLFSGIGLQLANPQVIRFFIDTAQDLRAGQAAGEAERALLRAAGLFMGFALAQHALNLAAIYAGQQVAWTATNRLRQALTLHVLRLDMGFHKQHTPGELISRIDGDATALGNFFAEFTLKVIGNGLLVAGILALLLREDWRVGAGLAVYTLATVLVLAGVQRFAVGRWAAARQASAELWGYLEERIGGAEDIRAAGAVGYALYRFFQLNQAWLKRYRAAFLAGSFIFNLTNLLSVAGYAAGLALGVWLYTRGEASVGTAYLIVAYAGMLAGPLQGLREQARDLQQSTASVERIQALFGLQPRVAELVAGTRALPEGALSVCFEGVTFGYEGDNDQPVLHDVSFTVQPGKVLGVLGRTGSGKTTLTRLLFRLYDVDEGAVRLGGVDVRSVPLAELRARVGMVTQEVQLFQASLRENLAFFSRRVSEADLARALGELGLADWTAALPHGLDTHLAGGGHGLSAGEAQLLAFARVFLKDPGLVVLDEASSRLDPATEHRLERAIDRLFAGRTGVVIAHRLRTVQRADDILILEAGRVVEFGPRAALAADPQSRFYQLLQTGLEAALA